MVPLASDTQSSMQPAIGIDIEIHLQSRVFINSVEVGVVCGSLHTVRLPPVYTFTRYEWLYVVAFKFPWVEPMSHNALQCIVRRFSQTLLMVLVHVAGQGLLDADISTRSTASSYRVNR